jgi:hypothetical protein
MIARSSPLSRILACTTVQLFASLLLGQTSAVKVDVKADFASTPDEVVSTIKMVKGDAGTVVALKTKAGVSALGGVHTKDVGWNVAVYDRTTMKMVKTDALTVRFGEDPVNLETIENFNNRLRLICTQPDLENNSLRLIQQLIDPRSLSAKGAQEFYRMPFDRLNKGADYYNRYMAVGFTSVINQDSSLMMLHLTPDNTVRSAGCPIHSMVFDRDLKLKWYNTLELTGSLQAMQIMATRVDKSGAAWYLIKQIGDMAPKDPKTIGYQYVLYRMDSLGQHTAVIDPPGGDYATDVRMELLPDGRVMCGGVYASDEHARGSSLGLFITTLDPATRNDPKGMRFGGYQQYEMNKVVDKKKGELPRSGVQMIRLLPRPDGSADLVAEDNELKTYTVSDLSGKSREKTNWEHGPIHVMRFPGGSGDPIFYTMIDRQLFYEFNEPGRVIATQVMGTLFLFMNDDESYVEKRKEKIPLERVAQAKDILMFEFKDDGTFKNKVFLKGTYENFLLDPEKVWYITPTLLGVPVAKGWDKKATQPAVIQFSPSNRR